MTSIDTEEYRAYLEAAQAADEALTEYQRLHALSEQAWEDYCDRSHRSMAAWRRFMSIFKTTEGGDA